MLIAALAAVLLVPAAAGANASGAKTSAQTSSDPTLTVSMTAYNAVPAQTDSTPDTTSIGAYTNPSIIAARSDDLASELPYGTVIEVESAGSSASCGYGSVGSEIGLRVIADAMNVKEHDKVDILLPQKQTSASGKTENPADVLGLCKDVTIKIVGHINVSDIPQTQGELASALDSSAQLAVAK